MLLHQTLCDHADDVGQLYKIWDDDLKKTHRRMEYWRWFAIACFVVAYLLWVWKGFSGYEGALVGFFALGISAAFAAIKISVDESNINYLMHQWDLVALDRIRRQ